MFNLANIYNTLGLGHTLRVVEREEQRNKGRNDKEVKVGRNKGGREERWTEGERKRDLVPVLRGYSLINFVVTILGSINKVLS